MMQAAHNKVVSIASHIFVSYHPLSLITAIMSYENYNEYLVRTGSAENHNGAREAMTDELVIPIPTPRSETTSFIPTDTTLPSQIDIITQLTPYDVVSGSDSKQNKHFHDAVARMYPKHKAAQGNQYERKKIRSELSKSVIDEIHAPHGVEKIQGR